MDEGIRAHQLPAHYSGLVDEWYCVLAVCGAPSASPQPENASRSKRRRRDEPDPESDSGAEEDDGASPSTRRTAVYHTTDPIGYVCRLNGDALMPFEGDAVEWHHEQLRSVRHRTAPPPMPATTSAAAAKRKLTRCGSSRYRIVFVIGPLPSQNSAVIVQTLLLWRSRGLVPRTAWGKLIAEHFYAHFWVNYEDVFPMLHHDVIHTDSGEVYIKEKTSLQQLQQ
jgi:hypothetical protein